MFDDYHGEYTDLGDPFVGDTDRTSFSSQVSCVLRLPESSKLIACADRWMPFPWIGALSRHTLHRFEKMFADYHPDLSPRTEGVSGKKNRYFELVRQARYVWLPIEWDGEKPVIRWVDEWKV